VPRYTEEQIEQVRSANDIVDVIGASVRLKRSGSGYVGLCPFHSEKSPSFSVNPARQMYKCFGCGVGGNVITFVMEYENYSFPEAMESLAERAGITLPKQEMTAKQKQEENLRSTLLEINAKAARYYYATLKSPKGKLGLEYLRGRQLSDETILRFGLGYAGQGVSFTAIYGMKGMMIAFCVRPDCLRWMSVAFMINFGTVLCSRSWM